MDQETLWPLTRLGPGQWADVAEVLGEPAWVGRMAELGVRVGSRLQMIQVGTPCLLQVGGSRLGLRADAAERILVRPWAGMAEQASFNALNEAVGQMVSLDQLGTGQRACVDAVQGTDALVQRLLEMGLFEGEEVEVVGFAPLGDPMEIRLRDYRLSLRRTEAARVLVTPLN